MHMQTIRIVRNNNDHTKLPKSLNRLRHFPQLFYLQSLKTRIRPKTLNFSPELTAYAYCRHRVAPYPLDVHPY